MISVKYKIELFRRSINRLDHDSNKSQRGELHVLPRSIRDRILSKRPSSAFMVIDLSNLNNH